MSKKGRNSKDLLNSPDESSEEPTVEVPSENIIKDDMANDVALDKDTRRSSNGLVNGSASNRSSSSSKRASGKGKRKSGNTPSLESGNTAPKVKESEEMPLSDSSVKKDEKEKPEYETEDGGENDTTKLTAAGVIAGIAIISNEATSATNNIPKEPISLPPAEITMLEVSTRQSVGSAVRTAMGDHAPNVAHEHGELNKNGPLPSSTLGTDSGIVDQVTDNTENSPPDVVKDSSEHVESPEKLQPKADGPSSGINNAAAGGAMAAMAAAGASVAAIIAKKGKGTDLDTSEGEKENERKVVRDKPDSSAIEKATKDATKPEPTAAVLNKEQDSTNQDKTLGPSSEGPATPVLATGTEPAVPTNKTVEILMEGFLIKPGRFIPSYFAKRWYSLDSNGDMTYKIKQLSRSQKLLPFKDRIVIMDNHLEKNATGSRHFFFDVVYEQRVRSFGAPSAESKNAWISALKRFEHSQNA